MSETSSSTSAAGRRLDHPEPARQAERAHAAMVVGLHERESRRAAADDEVKVVVLTGAGRAFSAGFDIGEEARAGSRAPSAGARCSRRTSTLTMRALVAPEADDRRGARLVPRRRVRARDGLRPRRRGRGRALRRAGDPLRLGPGHAADAVRARRRRRRTSCSSPATRSTRDEAERLGLVNRVVAGRRLEAAVDALVAKIAPTPLPVLRLTKLALVRAARGEGLRAGGQREPRPLGDPERRRDAREAASSPEIAAEQGLKAALAWRDGRYGEQR